MGSADDAVGHPLVKPKRKSRSTTGERHKLPVQTARIVPDRARSSLFIGVILGVLHQSLSSSPAPHLVVAGVACRRRLPRG
jgi:hypothetical protein